MDWSGVEWREEEREEERKPGAGAVSPSRAGLPRSLDLHGSAPPKPYPSLVRAESGGFG